MARKAKPERRTSLSRQDLEALLAQLDHSRSGAGSRTGRAGGAAGEAERTRLRGLVARALAERGTDGDPGHETQDRGDGSTDPDAWDADAGEDDAAADEPSPWEDEAGWDPWTSRTRWERFAPAKPIAVEGGLTTKSRRGAIGETWWSKRFLAAIEAVMEGGRSTRGRSYARKGQVVDLSVEAGLVEARVQGTRRAPYRVRLALSVVADEDWDRIVAALVAEAGYAARLLAGELPHEVEGVFATEGASLFPSPSARLTTDCTCPDWANPCKHVAAVCYLVAEEFDRDPFAVLAWRGRTRVQILDALRQLRAAGADDDPAAEPAIGGPGPAAAPPLDECLLGFWKAGAGLAGVRVLPEAAAVPAAILRHLVPGLVEVRGRDVAELLGPVYTDLAAAAARRARSADDGPAARRQGTGRSVS
ncbi:MAG: SWIM zinc finger family protein [Acidimicrobiales bacterium]